LCQSFFFNDTATTEIYTLSLHDALPISPPRADDVAQRPSGQRRQIRAWGEDRKSTRLNSSHLVISYAVFCLKKRAGECAARQGPAYNSIPRLSFSVRRASGRARSNWFFFRSCAPAKSPPPPPRPARRP